MSQNGKKRKTEGKDAAEDTQDSKKKAKENKLLVPTFTLPHFHAIPECTVSLLDPAPADGQRGSPVQLHIKQFKEPVQLQKCDLIIAEGFGAYKPLAKWSPEAKASCEDIQRQQAEFVQRCLPKGYVELSKAFTPAEMSMYVHTEAIKHNRLVQAKKGVLQFAARTLVTQTAIMNWLIANKRVALRGTGNFSHPQFLYCFFASDFGKTTEPEAGQEIRPTHVTLAQHIRKSLYDFDNTGSMYKPTLWERDPFKGLRSQRFQPVPIADEVLLAYDITPKEVQVRQLKHTGLVVTSYPAKTPHALHSLPQFYVHAAASPFMPALPPPPAESTLRVGDWMVRCAAPFTAKKEKKSDIEKTAKAKAAGDQTYEFFDAWSCNEAQRPYMYQKGNDVCWYALSSAATVPLDGHPNSPAALSNTNVAALFELVTLVKEGSKLPDRMLIREGVKKPRLAHERGEDIAVAGFAGSRQLKLVVAKDSVLPWEFLDFLISFGEKLILPLASIGATEESFCLTASATPGADIFTPDNAFEAYLCYLKVGCVVADLPSALSIAVRLLISEHFKEANRQTAVACLDLLQHGERLFYAKLAFLRSEPVTGDAIPAKISEQLLWLDQRSHYLFKFHCGATECTMQERKNPPGSAIRALLRQVSKLAHEYVVDSGHDAPRAWHDAAVELQAGPPLPAFSRDLFRALAGVTTGSARDEPDVSLIPEHKQPGSLRALAVKIVDAEVCGERQVIEAIKKANSKALVEEILRFVNGKH